ncbi:hypothetical protein [Thiolapillus sp.]
MVYMQMTQQNDIEIFEADAASGNTPIGSASLVHEYSGDANPESLGAPFN